MAAITDTGGAISIEIGTKAEAVSLLRLLERFRPWTAQLSPTRWVVVGRVDGPDGERTARALLATWAARGGRESIEVGFDDDLQRIAATPEDA